MSQTQGMKAPPGCRIEEPEGPLGQWMVVVDAGEDEGGVVAAFTTIVNLRLWLTGYWSGYADGLAQSVRAPES